MVGQIRSHILGIIPVLYRNGLGFSNSERSFPELIFYIISSGYAIFAEIVAAAAAELTAISPNTLPGNWRQRRRCGSLK
ncbi:hypothetical protein [Aquamicrobium ahrensii]|uniref:Uncharacterized protein n=1 Tax=Aquamicrobium ahrensii TaxID=469551 RepID=A0ABV2KFE6_9HYPH